MFRFQLVELCWEGLGVSLLEEVCHWMFTPGPVCLRLQLVDQNVTLQLLHRAMSADLLPASHDDHGLTL